MAATAGHKLAQGLRSLLLTMFGLLGVLALLAAGLWWWAGTDGSLATALRWADNYAPQLTSNISVLNASGSLRAGGHIDRITWQRDGLKVDAADVSLAWQPWALVSNTLRLDRIAAASVTVANQQPNASPSKPPESLRLPLHVVLEEFSIAQLSITGQAPFSAAGIAGSYRFDGQQHALVLASAAVASGLYRGRASVGADQPFALNAALSGTVTTALPGASQTIPLSFDAAAAGTLQDIQARALLKINSAATPLAAKQTMASTRVAATQPLASITALITPWANQPVPQADAVFQNLNVAALWPGAPQTLLTGSASVAPTNASADPATAGSGAWALQLQAVNRLPGPWDKNLLPVDKLAAVGQWRDGMVRVKSLDARLGGGALQASGQTAGTQTWAFQVVMENINPRMLNTQLAALPLGGQVEGSWDALRAGGTLALTRLNIKTREAQLLGTLVAEPAARGGKANVTLTAPGLVAKVSGELRKTTGKGELALRMPDAALALRWLRQLPGMPAPLRAATAAGSGELTASWQGGWQVTNSAALVKARMSFPALDITPVAILMSATPTLLKFRAVEVNVNGNLSQASLTAQGRLEAGQRRFALQAAADGGKAQGPKSNAWQAMLRQLALRVDDPALGAGTWQLATRNSLALKWMPGAFESSAGEALLTAPTQGTPALISWQPVKWQAGLITSAGNISKLPMAWLELVTGPQTAGIGLMGSLVFDGAWDAKLGDTLALKASLSRSSGDISMQPEGNQLGGSQTTGALASRTRISAGVRQARITLDSLGNDVTVALKWDSERAGTIDGQLNTRLAKAPTEGWQWPQDAPIAGQIRAQLPRIGVWSALAPPGWRLRGSLAADINIAGTRAVPELKGNLQADDLALRSVVDGIEFGNGKLRATLDGSRMRITQLTLQGAGGEGGGTLTALGEAAWINNQPSVTLDAQLNRLRASVRSDRQVTLSGSLQAALSGRQTRLTGSLKVDQARFILPDEGVPQLGDDVVVRGWAVAKKPGSADAAREVATRQMAAAPPSDGRSFTLGIRLDLGEDLRVEGKGLSTQLRGTLALSGESLAQPRLVGTVNTFAGSYRAYGQQLNVERGAIRFYGPLDNPTLDILAIRPTLSRVEQRVGVQILGTALLPRVSLYAQPDLPEAEKLSWLVLGRASASGGSEAALLQQAALALLGGKDGGMSGGLASSLGLDELSYRGASSNADGTTSSGAVTLGKRFSNNFYVAYERSVSGALGTLLVFYDLSQRFTIRAQAGQQSAVDLIFTIPFD